MIDERPRLNVVQMDVKNDFEASVESLERDEELMKRKAAVRARLYATFFQELVSEGVDEDSAAQMTQSEFLEF